MGLSIRALGLQNIPTHPETQAQKLNNKINNKIENIVTVCYLG
jgi:hypothetical protein